MMQTAAANAGDGRTVGCYVETIRVGVQRCRLCECKLGEADDFEALVCVECSGRPEAKRLGPPPAAGTVPKGAREFTAADKSLIRAVGAYMPVGKLLTTLNTRLVADLGPDAARYTLEQLGMELEAQGVAAKPAPREAGEAGGRDGGVQERGNDWAALRRMIGQARRSGVLAKISEQTIDDFAVVYSLSAAQVLHLKEVILKSQEQEVGNG